LDVLIKKKEKVMVVNRKPKQTKNCDNSYEEQLQQKESLLDQMHSSSNNTSRTESCGHECHLSLFNICCICSS
jgi:hypothetical protein